MMSNIQKYVSLIFQTVISDPWSLYSPGLFIKLNTLFDRFLLSDPEQKRVRWSLIS